MRQVLPLPLRPSGPGWTLVRRVKLATGHEADGWLNGDVGAACLSCVEIVEQNPPGSGIVAPHYHVSATHPFGPVRRACTDEEMERVRAAFGLAGAEEDNHGDGIARHLWILCGREREPACPCKQDEQRTVEGPRVRHDAAEDVAP